MSYADDLLAIARDHAKGNKTESNWRTAANRAYYSSFHALLVWEKQDIKPICASLFDSHAQQPLDSCLGFRTKASTDEA